MNAEYRPIFYAPDPFNGARWPIGAIVRTSEGVRAVRAPGLPSALSLGAPEHEAVVRWMADALHVLQSFQDRPLALGPYAAFGAAVRIPAGVGDPFAWVERHVLPQARNDAVAKPRREAGHHSVGRAFFKTWEVGAFVHDGFLPDRDWDARLAEHAGRLERVSHWTGGAGGLLLMEAVKPDLVRRDHDIRHVATRSRAYKAVLDEVGVVGAEIVGVILPGGDAAAWAKVEDALDGNVHRMVDTRDSRQRRALLAQIRDLGAPQTSILSN